MAVRNDGQGNDRKLIRNSTAEFLTFTSQAGSDSIEVRYEDKTIWLTQKLMATLFDVSVPTISEHLKNIYGQGELTRKATIREFLTVRMEGGRQVTRKVDYYNLDAIISVGYRVNSVRATQFRQWATQVLSSFALRGYAPDEQGQRIEKTRKPRRCPSCGASPMATIMYGMPAWSPELKEEIQAGKIVLGGCCITMDDPVWQCTNCGLTVYRKRDPLIEEFLP